MITDTLYQNYFNDLLAGRRAICQETVQRLLDQDIDVKTIYTDLFQRSMYQVGDLWENGRITVANEHLATTITESLLNLIYPKIFARPRVGKAAIISCTANEYHQIGGKMVADFLELNGWDGYFLGANTPPDEILPLIQDIQPLFVGFSLSVLSNFSNLVQAITVVRADFPDMTLLVGGQAFRWGGKDRIANYTNVQLVGSLDELETLLGLQGQGQAT